MMSKVVKLNSCVSSTCFELLAISFSLEDNLFALSQVSHFLLVVRVSELTSP